MVFDTIAYNLINNVDRHLKSYAEDNKILSFGKEYINLRNIVRKEIDIALNEIERNYKMVYKRPRL
jgi:hypothetical protein